MSHKTLTARTPHLIRSGVLPVVHINVRPLGATHANSGGGKYTKCGRFDKYIIEIPIRVINNADANLILLNYVNLLSLMNN